MSSRKASHRVVWRSTRSARSRRSAAGSRWPCPRGCREKNRGEKWRRWKKNGESGDVLPQKTDTQKLYTVHLTKFSKTKEVLLNKKVDCKKTKSVSATVTDNKDLYIILYLYIIKFKLHESLHETSLHVLHVLWVSLSVFCVLCCTFMRWNSETIPKRHWMRFNLSWWLQCANPWRQHSNRPAFLFVGLIALPKSQHASKVSKSLKVTKISCSPGFSVFAGIIRIRTHAS